MLTDRRYYIEVLIRGVVVRVSDPPSISESLDGFGTTAEFSLLDRISPPPQDGDAVRIRRVKLSNNTYQNMFGGYLSTKTVDSEPFNLTLRAVDELSKFDAVRTGTDLDLTGMTDKEVWTTLADVCDLEYDPDDIVDIGYEVGQHAKVYWKVDSTAASVIQELDEVCGCKTMTVGNNRTIRFAYDLAPDEDLSQVTYEKGVSPDLYRLQESTGSVGQIQSIWRVTSTDFKCGTEDKCSCVVWAKAVDSTLLPKKGKKRSIFPKQEFSSAFIQDEGIAESIARRFMRWYNRTPLILSMSLEMNPSIHPGSVVSVIDNTYGIGHAAATPYTIITVEKRGLDMTISAVGGAAGSEGDVTHGVEQQCNKNTGSTDWPGDGIGGGIDVPPFELDLPWPEDTPGGSPLFGCTTAGTFQTCPEDSDLDECIPGSGVTSDEVGTVPEDFCITYLGPNRLQPKSFTAGSGAPPDDFTATCRVWVPWRERSGGPHYHINEDGVVDWIQTNGGTSFVISANGEMDPLLQGPETDSDFGTPLQTAIQGTVTFNQAGSYLAIRYAALEDGDEETFDGATVVIYADPGLEISPGGSSTDYIFGIELNGCTVSALKVGDGEPNHSYGALTRDNGGYVPSTPAALGVPVNFTFFFDETYRRQWGRIVANTDLGSGYLDNLDYLSEGIVFPGEPQDPSNPCSEDHQGHVLVITGHAGGIGTQEAPAVKLEGIVLGHSTCATDEGYVP